jgi:hypothetical protein
MMKEFDMDKYYWQGNAIRREEFEAGDRQQKERDGNP